MKKISAFLLIICMMIPLFAVHSFAAESGVITVVAGESAKRGENVTISVELNSNPGFTGIRLKLEYDKNVLELVSAKDLGVIPGAMFTDNVEGEEFYLLWANNLATDDITKTGRIAEAVFKVKDDAPICDTEINLSYSKDNFDIMNHALGNVPFEITGDSIKITCTHTNIKENILYEATFEKEGKKETVCADCGKVIEEKLLPVLQTQDGVYATVQAGEFESDLGKEDYIEPTLTFLKITSGAEFDAIKKLYPNVSTVFQIKMTKNGIDYIPVGKATVTLDGICDFNAKTRLYKLVSPEEAKEIECMKIDKKLSFDYENTFFFLADDLDPEIPGVSTVPFVTADPDDLIISREKFIIVCAIVAVVFFGGLAAAFIVRGKDKNL